MVKATKYDIFISYVDADRAWVEGYLLDALKQAGVSCYSEATFAPGKPRLQQFEEAIKQSRRTLLVLSPAYRASDVTQIIDLLAQSYGLEMATWPVIPMILKPVKLPPRLSLLVPLNATNEDEWKEAIERLCTDLKPSKSPVPVPESKKASCPYPGMVSFNEADSDRFFGRDQEIEKLLTRLHLHSFIAVIGPSGSGKSSLVFAGLIPVLPQSGLFGSGEWLINSMRPGETPLATLETALGGDPVEPELAVTQALANQPDARRLLLVVDQFEEVFTQAQQQAVPFQKALLRLVEIPNCYVILTVRADFYPDLMQSLLWLQIESHRLELVPLDAAGLHEAINKPAKDVGVFIEAALVERLVLDAAGEPGILPLIQETLVLLWEKVERRFLPLRAYETLVLASTAYRNVDGSNRTGLQVAIANRADAAIANFSEQQQVIARRLFLRLIQFGEGRADTRRQQSVNRLQAVGDDLSLFDETLKHLAQNRLLTLSGGEEDSSPKVDIAHEALIEGWPALQQWLDERREAEQIRRRLVHKSEEWVRLGKGGGGLLDEAELPEAERWLDSPDANELGYDERLLELVKASREAIREARQREEEARQRELKRERKLRQAAQRNTFWAITTTIITFLAGVVLVFSWWDRQRSVRIIENVTINSNAAVPELLRDLPAFLQIAERRRESGEMKLALAYYQKIVTEVIKLRRENTANSEAFQPLEQQKIEELWQKAEQSIVEIIRQEQIPQLQQYLSNHQVGYLLPNTSMLDYEKQYTEGALQATYAILMRESGAKADANDDGEINNPEEAERLPCETLKELEELWRRFTENRCGWYGKNSFYENPECSELDGRTLTEKVFLFSFDPITFRLISCQIAPQSADPYR